MSMFGKYPKVKNEYGEEVEQVARPVVDCSDDDPLTIQSDREEADINKILARFEKMGMPPVLGRTEPLYGDVSEFDGLQDAFIKVQKAEEAFMNVAPDVREKFDNDPVKFVDFLKDEKNRPEAEKLGLLVPKKPVVEPAPAPAGAAPAPSAGTGA